jgi:type IV secretion system protein VirB6
MSGCDALVAQASAGAAPALRAVDCLANQATGAAFGRLFGTDGALLPALTILLTLYIAFFAVSLLTGRSALGVSALTPRMMTLGLVLTFATSWVAYQGVVWNLAVGAPDQVAGVLMGASGSGASATTLFADRIDIVFAAIQAVGEMTAQPVAEGAAPQAAQGSFTPGNLMWLAALLLLLGTVGVLVTARIALAVLLALGPIFVVMALFGGTRGLTAGWLRGVVLCAVTPLFVVLGGGLMLELLVPVVQNLAGDNASIDGRAALALFVIAAVHVALMAMVLKVTGTMVAGWSVFGLARGEPAERRDRPALAALAAASAPAAAGTYAAAANGTGHAPQSRRAAAIVPVDAMPGASAPTAPSVHRNGRTVVVHAPGAAAPLPALRDNRARGIGSRFSAKPSREMLR